MFLHRLLYISGYGPGVVHIHEMMNVSFKFQTLYPTCFFLPGPTLTVSTGAMVSRPPPGSLRSWSHAGELHKIDFDRFIGN